MAIGTPTSAGTSASFTTSTTPTITVSVTAGNRLFIVVGGPTSTSRTVSGVSGASLTFAVAKAFTQTGGFVEIWSAHCASTVTSQTITVTLSGSALAGAIAAVQCSGLNTSSPLDGSGSSAGRPTPANQFWTSGNAVTTNANDLIVAASCGDFAAPPTNTPSGTVINELVDFASANDIGLVVQYVIVSATQAAIAGTGGWNQTPAVDMTVLAAFMEDSGTPAELPILVMAPPVPT